MNNANPKSAVSAVTFHDDGITMYTQDRENFHYEDGTPVTGKRLQQCIDVTKPNAVIIPLEEALAELGCRIG